MTKLSKVACFSSLMYRYTSRLIVIYLNIWTEHLQSYLSSRKVLSKQTIFFIKFEIFLIKGIVIESLVQINSLSFPFVKKTLKNWSNHYVWYSIPKQANTIERTFQVLYPLFAKIMFSFKVHQFWIHRYWDNYTDSNFTCKSSEVRNLS